MGVVYEAFDLDRGQRVALKTLAHCDAEGLLRFKNEFRMLHDLDHPNVVSLGELFEADHEWFFTMEFVDGVDFLTHVGRAPDERRVALLPTARSQNELAHSPGTVSFGGFDEAKLRAALRGLAAGLVAIHAADLVHRDVKPSNILVTEHGRVVLLDFGLVTPARSDLRSGSQVVAGTAAYMAPEQATSYSYGPAADWYSVGVILYEALTGRLPHDGGSPLELVMNKQHHEPAPPSHWSAGVPADLDELCMRLLATKPHARPHADEICSRLEIAPTVTPNREQASARRLRSTTDVFVGREDELRVLARQFAEARTRPAMVVIEGESGVGKSRLAEQFAQVLQRDHEDAVILAGRCYERESVPYKAFDGIADELSRFMAHLPLSEAAALLPGEAGLLPRLFQVFQRVEAIAQAPREKQHDDPQEQRRRMFEALRELLARLAQQRPVVLVIDDFQWTDSDSIGLLRALLTHADAPPLLLVATMRPLEPGATRELLTKLFHVGRATHVALAELSREHAIELARCMIPDASASLLSDLARESGGNPLFVQELARGTVGALGVPNTSLDDALWSRIEGLPRDCRDILEAVCVAGSPTDQEVAAHAVGQSFAAFSRLIRGLRSAHLVRTNGVRRTDTILSFHDRVRELMVRKLDRERQRHWHGRLAVALERAGAAKADPHALVLHAEAAGDRERAADYALAAARHAIDATAFDKAAQFLAIALRLGCFDSADERRTVQLELAGALSNAGRGPEAAAMFERAAVDANAAVRTACQRQAAQQWLVSGHIAKGLEALSASLAEIGETLPSTPRRALFSLLKSRVLLRLRGMRWSQRDDTEIAPAVLNRLDVLKTVGHNLAVVDNIRGADYNARFLRLALKTGEPTRVAFATATEAVFVASQGPRSFARSLRLVDEVRRIADAQPDSRLLAGWAKACEGWVSHLQGEFKHAEAALRESSALLRNLGGTTYEQNNSQLWRVYALRQLGAVNELRVAMPRYLHDAEQRGDRFVDTSLRRNAGRIALLAADDPRAAREDLARATWEPPEGGYHVQHWFEVEALGEISLYEATTDERAEWFEAQLELLERSLLHRVQIIRTFATWMRARLLLASRAPRPEATQRARKLAARLRRERIGYANVMSALVSAAAAVQDERDGPAGAAEHLRNAIAFATDNDMALHRAAAQHRLGVLLGGSEGRALAAESRAWMRDQGIVNPARMMDTVAPGFEPKRASDAGR